MCICARFLVSLECEVLLRQFPLLSNKEPFTRIFHCIIKYFYLIYTIFWLIILFYIFIIWILNALEFVAGPFAGWVLTHFSHSTPIRIETQLRLGHAHFQCLLSVFAVPASLALSVFSGATGSQQVFVLVGSFVNIYTILSLSAGSESSLRSCSAVFVNILYSLHSERGTTEEQM